MAEIDEVIADYQTTVVSLIRWPLCARLDAMSPRRRSSRLYLIVFVRVAGLVVLRQRPGTAKGITFVTLEDESGSMNLVLRPDVWDRHYNVARTSNAWLVTGVLENREGVIHVVVGRLDDLSKHVSGLQVRSRDFH
ncbi:MAG: OB-fold nucleic acid binding domain-containing protein [Pirellulales bacterium]